MAINDLSFNQLASVLNSIHRQATGVDALTPTNTNEFVSMAQATLQTGYDPVISAISQVLGRTIFAIRPYNRKFAGLQVDNQRWGYITRKINIADKAFIADDRILLTEGSSVDQYIVNKPEILQTNFYGQNVYAKMYTIFKDQLDCAFRNEDEFRQFLSMVTQNASDMIEQAHENTARACVCNFIAGKYTNQNSTENVVHLLTEYNTESGLTLTSTTVYQPANFKPFMQWVYARVAKLASMLTERSTLFHANVTNFGGTESGGVWTGGVDKTLMRHTPYDKLKVYMLSDYRYKTEAQVLADTYHDNYLRYADVETVNFWQAIKAPDQINVKPVWINAGGEYEDAGSAVSMSDVFGVMFDEDALGYTVMNQWAQATPFNARGGYTNMFYHFTDRYWNDATENGIVLMLD